jgi:hypothetical protein
MIKSFNPNKQYYTVRGTPVMIYNWNCGGTFPIHGAVQGSYRDVVWTPCFWTKNGKTSYSGFELVDKRPKKSL